jgi:hypothetical protein
MIRNSLDNRGSIGAWLIHCADPLGPRTAAPRRELSPPEAMALVDQAERHGVLPAVLRNFPAFQRDRNAFAVIKAAALARQRTAYAFAAMLRHVGDGLMTAAAGLPMVIVKGPVFAHSIYPAPRLRPFTDIDVLVAPRAVGALSAMLETQGFDLAEHDRSYPEWKWLHRENDALMVEVQTDLVHAPSLRRTLSLTYDDIATIAETPAAQLIIAIVHGSLGNHFAKLGQVVDICQAARKLKTAEDERRFESLVERTGARLAATTGLALAGRFFEEPRCLDIARAFGPQPSAWFASLLIGKSVVLSTTTSARSLHAWRRQTFRLLLKCKPHRRPSPAVEAALHGREPLVFSG